MAKNISNDLSFSLKSSPIGSARERKKRKNNSNQSITELRGKIKKP
jgi:hypothetical protein